MQLILYVEGIARCEGHEVYSLLFEQVLVPKAKIDKSYILPDAYQRAIRVVEDVGKQNIPQELLEMMSFQYEIRFWEKESFFRIVKEREREIREKRESQ